MEYYSAPGIAQDEFAQGLYWSVADYYSSIRVVPSVFTFRNKFL